MLERVPLLLRLGILFVIVYKCSDSWTQCMYTDIYGIFLPPFFLLPSSVFLLPSRFAQFFIAPLFREDCTQREVRGVGGRRRSDTIDIIEINAHSERCGDEGGGRSSVLNEWFRG